MNELRKMTLGQWLAVIWFFSWMIAGFSILGFAWYMLVADIVN